MGVSIDQGGGKGRKSVDSELNLIPFIDLLSVCILFLLMTAVWVHISKMSAFSQPSGEALISHSEVSSINQAKEERDYDFLIRTSGVEIKQDGRTLGQFDLTQLEAKMDQIKKQGGAAFDPKISLRSADDVVYDDVIYVLDQIFTRGWTKVTVGGF